MNAVNFSDSGSGNTLLLYWDEHDIAAYYRVSIRTIQRWVRAGFLPSPLRMGRKKMWMVTQVKEWMLLRGTEAAAEAEKERARLANYSWKGRA